MLRPFFAYLTACTLFSHSSPGVIIILSSTKHFARRLFWRIVLWCRSICWIQSKLSCSLGYYYLYREFFPHVLDFVKATPNAESTIRWNCLPGALRVVPVLLSDGLHAYAGIPHRELSSSPLVSLHFDTSCRILLLHHSFSFIWNPLSLFV